MSATQKFIFYTTIFGLFSANLSFGVGSIHLLAFYFILLINLGILTARGYLWLPRKLVLFVIYLFVSGLIGIISGTGSTVGFLKAFSGIVPCALYYPAFFRYFRFDLRRCFEAYARVAFYAAVFGIFYLPFQGYPVGRLRSVLIEPAAYSLVVLPAVFYYADQWQRMKRYRFRCLVLLLSVLLSFSTLGICGLMFGAFLLARRHKYGKVFAPVLACALGIAAFSFSDMFRLRITDAFTGTVQGGLATINESTYTSAISFFVTERVLEDHPLIGGGLGSFFTSHDRYFPLIPGTEIIFDEGRRHLSEWDASSLLLRIAAELGLVGLGGTLWFLRRFYPNHGDLNQRAIAGAILCYVVAKFVRDGIYFNPEVFFFFSAYAINGLLAQQSSSRRQRNVVIAHSSTGVVAASGA